MKKLLPLLLCILWISGAGAQTWQSAKTQAREKQQRHELLKTQPLLVRLQEADPKRLRTLRAKPDELKAYQAAVVELNEKIARTAARFWKLSPSIEYKSGAEMQALLSQNAGQLNILEYGPVQVAYSNGSVGDRLATARDLEMGFTLKAVVGKSTWILDQQTVMGQQLHESDIIFCFRMMENTVNGTAIKQFKGKPSELTLLISQDSRPADLTDEKIRKVYPYPYKFVDRAAFEQAVREGEAGYGYVRFLPEPIGGCATLAFTMPTLEILGTGDLQQRKDGLYVTAKDFKELAKSFK